MDTNKAIITSNTISERWRLSTKIKGFFIKASIPSSTEIPKFQFRDNDEIIFKTGEEMWQDAKKKESKMQPKIRPKRFMP